MPRQNKRKINLIGQHDADKVSYHKLCVYSNNARQDPKNVLIWEIFTTVVHGEEQIMLEKYNYLSGAEACKIPIAIKNKPETAILNACNKHKLLRKLKFDRFHDGDTVEHKGLHAEITEFDEDEIVELAQELFAIVKKQNKNKIEAPDPELAPKLANEKPIESKKDIVPQLQAPEVAIDSPIPLVKVPTYEDDKFSDEQEVGDLLGFNPGTDYLMPVGVGSNPHLFCVSHLSLKRKTDNQEQNIGNVTHKRSRPISP